MKIYLQEDIEEIFGLEKNNFDSNIQFYWDSLSVICALALIKEKYHIDPDPNDITEIKNITDYELFIFNLGVKL